MSSTEIQKHTGELVDRAEAWSTLSDDVRRRRAMLAANRKDTAELWSPTEAYVATKGKKRAAVSPNTLKSYEYGVRTALEHLEGENLLRLRRDAGDRLVNTLIKTGLKPGSIAVILSAAKQLFKAFRWAGAFNTQTEPDEYGNPINPTPFSDVSAPPDPDNAEDKRPPYTEDELEQLLGVASDVDRVLILLGALDVPRGRSPEIHQAWQGPTPERAEPIEVGWSNRDHENTAPFVAK